MISVSVTSMLAMIAYRFVAAKDLPRLPYLTRMDFFLLGSAFLMLLGLVGVVAIARCDAADKPDAVEPGAGEVVPERRDDVVRVLQHEVILEDHQLLAGNGQALLRHHLVVGGLLRAGGLHRAVVCRLVAVAGTAAGDDQGGGGQGRVGGSAGVHRCSSRRGRSAMATAWAPDLFPHGARTRLCGVRGRRPGGWVGRGGSVHQTRMN
ncbi:hypothetical protein [uncultured Demequina sp.]|uniref:hypothetical protein n=1 Tax=uncultured Demequina sp. TaxID=693499 RepID=UPI0025F4C7E2|nr:hypothetical protein [uncultured Demequina sp.]